MNFTLDHFTICGEEAVLFARPFSHLPARRKWRAFRESCLNFQEMGDLNVSIIKKGSGVCRTARRHKAVCGLAGDKKALIDFACQRFNIGSFADLGGVWNVDGGYTFYALQTGQIEKAFLVDTDFTQSVFRQQAAYPALQLLKGNFGSEETINKIGKVDAAMFFDTLLHQVNPDWDKVLGRR